MCNVHKKSLEIICINDLKRICSHCAIFGGHKNHKFKSFQEFNEDYEEKIKNLQILKQKKYVQISTTLENQQKTSISSSERTPKQKAFTFRGIRPTI